jgi:hypothetical protein
MLWAIKELPIKWIKVVVILAIMSLVAAALLYLSIRSWRICRRDKNKAEEMISWPTTTASAKDWEVTEGAGFRRKYPGYISKIT